MDELLFKIAEALQLAHDELPNNREAAMVRTKLDEARLWTKDIMEKYPQ